MKLSVTKLPQEIQNKLLILQRRGEDRIVFPTKLSIFYWIGLAAGIFWLIYLITATQTILWEDWLFWIFAGLTFVASLITVFCASKILKYFLAKLKNTFVFTRDEFLILDSNAVESWNLKQIEAVRYLEDTKRLEVWSGERQIFVPVSFEKEAHEIVDVFDNWKNNAGEGFLDKFQKDEFAYNSSKTVLNYASGFVIALVLAGIFSFSAQKLNRSSDDRLIWEQSKRENNIDSYEKYKKLHPDGAFVGEAEAKIGEYIGRLKSDYAASIKKDNNPDAFNTFSAVLDAVAKQSERKIYVKVTEKRELDDAVVEKLRKNYRSSIFPYYSTIPPHLEEERKNKVFSDTRQVFYKFAKNNLVNFEKTDELPADKPSIEVNYTAKSEEMIFQFYTVTGTGMVTQFYPGARYFFTFTMKTGGAESPFAADFNVLPARLNTAAYDQRDAVNYSFEKVFFNTVSENYGNYVAQQFGLGNSE
ncbi:MAG TPA: hypothetical protein PKY59_17335 [Pyrinomonadaceae bacterium]|nr:hypothetical protein [Pyrinomonadaceae bacterium]